MTSKYSISLYLDTRYKKQSGKYPVKLRVFTSAPRKQKMYSTSFEFDESEFKQMFETLKPRKEQKESKEALQAIETHAKDTAKKLPVFTFEAFEAQLLGVSAKHGNTVNHYYEKQIKQYKKDEQISTASSYDLSLKSLLAFSKKDTLYFQDITTSFLKDYEKHQLKNGKSITTVGIYLRPLRSIFNSAIEDNVITQSLYPFGSKKGKYAIPAHKGVKKALNKEQLKQLFNAESATPEQEKAKDFWFLSYNCNGINIKDLLNLTYGDVDGNRITFRRAKSFNTNREQAPVTLILNDYMRSTLDKYKQPKETTKTYLFDVLKPNMNAIEMKRVKDNFNRFINQHLQKLIKANDLDIKVSPKLARHTFATFSITEAGASMEFVSEALGHSNLKTTMNYFKGFEDTTKAEISNKLMDF